VKPRAVDWGGVVLVTLCGALAGLVEAMLVPLYAGSVIVPVAVVLAIAGNIALPRMARAFVPTTPASLLPLVAWLVVMITFVWGRPEGDVAFPAKPTAVVWVFYGVLLGGVVAGIVAVIGSMPPPATRSDAARPSGRVSR
jgi:hypothetical protein